MKKIIRFLFMFLLCINLNVSSNKKDYSNYVTHDTVDVLNQYEFNNYLSMCQNIVYQNGYYAPYYFKNLTNNFPVNSHGSCNYTAVAMLLSFYDTYWNDNIIPDNYEVNTNLNTSHHVHNKPSPGTTYEPDSVKNTSMDVYNNYLINSYNVDFQSFLIKVGKDFGVNVNTMDLGLDALEVEDLIHAYLKGTRSIHTYNIEASSYLGHDIYNFTINYLKNGLPVLLRVGNGFDNHTVIAYDFNELDGEIYVHMGWKINGTALTKVPLSETIYTEIYNAIVLVPDNNHVHSNNFFAGNSKYCPCQLMYTPNNVKIKSDTNYVDKTPAYLWDTTYKERWFSQEDFNYKIDVIDTNENIITTYFTENNNFEMTRPADFKDICEIYKKYKLKVEYNYLGNNSLYFNSSSTKSFIAPSDFSINPYLTPSTTYASTTSFETPNYRSYNVNNNNFTVNHYRTMYNSNDDITMMSCIDGGVNTSYILFDFETDITRMDIELAIYSDSASILTKGSYSINVRKCSETNQFTEVQKVVGDSDDALLEELPVGINNLERITIYFDEPIDKFDIRVKYTGDSQTTSLGKIAVGDIYFYKYDGSNILPLSGYELDYNPGYWNETIVGYNSPNDPRYLYEDTNCYSYAFNATKNEYRNLQPGKSIDDPIYRYDEAYANQEYNQKYLDNLIRLLKADSEEYNYTFILVSRYEICPIGTYKIALVADISLPYRDFHFYRQDSNGYWSHKQGNGEVINVDGINERITDPKECIRIHPDNPALNYEVFIGFYAVTPIC